LIGISAILLQEAFFWTSGLGPTTQKLTVNLGACPSISLIIS
jgi:hypothetical protein